MSLPGSPPVVFYDSLRSGGLTSKGHVECGNRYCPTSGAYPGDKDFERRRQENPYAVKGAFTMEHLRVGIYMRHLHAPRNLPAARSAAYRWDECRVDVLSQRRAAGGGPGAHCIAHWLGRSPIASLCTRLIGARAA